MTSKSDKEITLFPAANGNGRPEEEEQLLPALDDMTPREIVKELDKYIVGQAAAKRAVAVALRNRVRRQKLPPEIAEDVLPKNILMIGPTGVGKTEIARRLARLAGCPFVKVEASKYTEVGYVGRDVESMVRDLVETSIDMVREEKLDEVADRAEESAEERILDLLLPPPPPPAEGTPESELAAQREQTKRTREKLRAQLREGKLDQRIVDLEVRERAMPSFEIISNQGIEEMDVNLKDMLSNFSGLFGQQKKKRKMSVSDAFEYLIQEEENKLLDMDQVTRVAVERAEQMGIIFVDEIDKVAGRESGHGPDVSREGVQRDILPIIEGTTVNTRYGMIRTDHILFVAAGAFHVTKPSDLIPELQGRLPIRVEMQSLKEEDFVRILTEPKNALIKQYIALLDTEGVKLSFYGGRGTGNRAICNQRERTNGKHRRASVAHDPRKGAGRAFFRSARSEEKNGEGRCGLRQQAAGGYREEPGSEPVHPIKSETRKWKFETRARRGSAPSGSRVSGVATFAFWLRRFFWWRAAARPANLFRRLHPYRLPLAI